MIIFLDNVPKCLKKCVILCREIQNIGEKIGMHSKIREEDASRKNSFVFRALTNNDVIVI